MPVIPPVFSSYGLATQYTSKHGALIFTAGGLANWEPGLTAAVLIQGRGY